MRLEEYCVESKISYIAFDTFAETQSEVAKIMLKDERKTGCAGKSVRFNPRANLWRRASSKNSVSCSLFSVVANERVLTDSQVP